jgi:tRNA(fMet)-specific endonuclease VapC
VIHFDTSFLIDLHREVKTERLASAFELMETLNEREALGVSVHVLCELRAGAELSKRVLQEHEALDQLLQGFHIAHTDERFMPAYGRLSASLVRARQQIGAMDLLIATHALIEDAELVTKNVKHFSRVPGLRVLSY